MKNDGKKVILMLTVYNINQSSLNTKKLWLPQIQYTNVFMCYMYKIGLVFSLRTTMTLPNNELFI